MATKIKPVVASMKARIIWVVVLAVAKKPGRHHEQQADWGVNGHQFIPLVIGGQCFHEQVKKFANSKEYHPY